MKLDRKKVRQVYKENIGDIPKGYQIHHIIPIFAGGKIFDIKNFKLVTVKEHFKEHYKRWLKYNDIRDLYSCQLLHTNHLQLTEEEKKLIASKGGKAAQKTLKEKQISAFYDPKLRFKISSKGGKNGALTKKCWMKKGFTEKEAIEKIKQLQSSFGKKGGIKNKGFIWINDGKKSIKYTQNQQYKCSIDEYLIQNPSYKKGRLPMPIVKCPHCGKNGVKSAMVLHHFNKCKDKK